MEKTGGKPQASETLKGRAETPGDPPATLPLLTHPHWLCSLLWLFEAAVLGIFNKTMELCRAQGGFPGNSRQQESILLHEWASGRLIGMCCLCGTRDWRDEGRVGIMEIGVSCCSPVQTWKAARVRLSFTEEARSILSRSNKPDDNKKKTKRWHYPKRKEEPYHSQVLFAPHVQFW
ncbi:hypothetical protein IHE44_0014769, partial [Lamprotornis superbus]